MNDGIRYLSGLLVIATVPAAATVIKEVSDKENLMRALVFEDEDLIKKYATGKVNVAEDVAKAFTNGDFDSKSFKDYVKAIDNPKALDVMVDYFSDLKSNFKSGVIHNTAIKGLEIIKEEMKTKGQELSRNDIPMMHAKAVALAKIFDAQKVNG